MTAPHINDMPNSVYFICRGHKHTLLPTSTQSGPQYDHLANVHCSYLAILCSQDPVTLAKKLTLEEGYFGYMSNTHHFKNI